MTAEDTEQATDEESIRPVRVDIDGYTDPAVGFRRDGGERCVVSANDAFRTVAGFDPREHRLAVVLDRCLTDGSELAAAVPDGKLDTTVEFVGETATYRPRVAHDGAGAGHLLFVPDESSGVGSEAVAHVVSHDLRNPLDVAKAHLRVARDERDGEHLQKVAGAHDRMEQIIHDVLTLARGASAVEPEPSVDLEARLQTAWESVATEHGTLCVDSSLPETRADGRRVERLFENLLRNAVEHGGSSVRAGGLSDTAGFYVADDGEGVAPGEREAVFEPGYSGSATGTGLGLAIVDRIASAHGWRVELTESRDGGARIEIRVSDGGAES